MLKPVKFVFVQFVAIVRIRAYYVFFVLRYMFLHRGWAGIFFFNKAQLHLLDLKTGNS